MARGEEMTFEEMRKKLYSFRDARGEFERSKRELEEIETMIQGLSIDYSKPRVSSSTPPDALSKTIDKLIQVRNKCAAQGVEASKRMQEVKEIIESVEDIRVRAILSRRYLSCQHWNTIAYEMRTDRRWCIRLHDREVMRLCKGV